MAERMEKKCIQKGSVTYFTKGFERTILFVMTMFMLGWGIVVKLEAYLAH